MLFWMILVGLSISLVIFGISLIAFINLLRNPPSRYDWRDHINQPPLWSYTETMVTTKEKPSAESKVEKKQESRQPSYVPWPEQKSSYQDYSQPPSPPSDSYSMGFWSL